jgi:2-polyprenyl-3-methyl-5-hydroxy-6-metoxy-1,4-benzoquinol methylase
MKRKKRAHFSSETNSSNTISNATNANMSTDNSYNQSKADAFKESMYGVVTSAMLLTTIRLGHELGIFHELNKNGPATTTDLAKRLEMSPRYTFEWCLHAAASGILEYDEDIDKFALPPEHATIMDSGEGIISVMSGLVENISYQYPLLKLAYKTDGGIFWGDMRGMSEGLKGYFKPVYEQLMTGWIDLSPSLKASMSKPEAKIADLGCGCGVSTRTIALNFPNASVLGIDYHAESIQNAKEEIASKNLTNADARVVDSHVWAEDEEQGSFSVVTMFDCFHDMSDPEGVANEAFKALEPGGRIFLIEPYSSKSDTTKAKLEAPMVATLCGFSSCFCTPCGKAVPGKEGLGTTAGTDRYEALFKKVGFTSFETFGEDVEGGMSPSAMGFRLMLATK